MRFELVDLKNNFVKAEELELDFAVCSSVASTGN